ncbi:shikimate kinase [Fibrella forsythiae]|uniref:Shikimate kinase n=1 Tax=Fibrella forsythiae TaxID=2817061 RepID=A0ABS3JLP8_9BACT|nr:shikimate kinase [Fibrella forsythiae]MBO0950932.1 shikimate kinase [Fibrella forsythiae]
MKNIYLIGMPSSGKTTLGKRLARELHYHFIDTDRLIIREEGRSIADIFAQEGEAYFRQAEARILRTIKPGGSLVVATGGGMPCFHDNMTYIKSSGVSVFLDVAPEALAQRMIAHAQQFPSDAPERPLFNAEDQALLDNLRQRHTHRLPIYRQADIIITGDATEQDVLNLLGDWL